MHILLPVIEVPYNIKALIVIKGYPGVFIYCTQNMYSHYLFHNFVLIPS